MRLRGVVAIGLVLTLTIIVGGCASRGDSSQASTPTKVQTSEAANPIDEVPNEPASSPLSQIEIGMDDSQVRDLLGEPSNVRGYATDKGRIPFYFGEDTYRFDWLYPGQGKVVFSRTSLFGSTIEVVEIIQDPNQQ